MSRLFRVPRTQPVGVIFAICFCLVLLGLTREALTAFAPGNRTAFLITIGVYLIVGLVTIECEKRAYICPITVTSPSWVRACISSDSHCV